MGNDRIIPYLGERIGAEPGPANLRPDQQHAWDDIVSLLSPRRAMKVDMGLLGFAAMALASYRHDADLLDEDTRARQILVLWDVLEEAFVSETAIPQLLRSTHSSNTRQCAPVRAYESECQGPARRCPARTSAAIFEIA
jgi:hypothetical protein